MNAAALALFLATLHLAPAPDRTLEGDACRPWERIECWSDRSSAFEEEAFNDETQHLEKSVFGAGIPEAFGGTRRPHSRSFLLHYAPGWSAPKREVPVLLVHGAQSDATRSWASTWFDGRRGLAWYLAERGFAVFAITFPCGQGNLHVMAEHVANAIAVVRMRTGATKVDVVAHSAGGIAARMYATGVRESWGTRYRGDVRRVVFVATPHKGLDFIFRHPIAFVRFHSYGMPAPWEWYEPMGDVLERSVHAEAYVLQRMLLADLSGDHPLNRKEPDWYTTWHGGKGFVSRSRGIAAAIREGGNHMAKVRAAHFPRDLEVFVLAGSRRELQYIEQGTGRMVEETGEYDGPSDGIVFVDGATDPEGFAAAGARVVRAETLPMNHVELLFLEGGQAWIATSLNGGPIDDDGEGREEGGAGDDRGGLGPLDPGGVQRTGGDDRDDRGRPGESVPLPGGGGGARDGDR